MGIKTKKFKNGSVYKGDIHKSKRHGKGKQTWSDGRAYEGEWKDDAMHGRGVYTWPDGRMYVGDFISDIMTGKGIFFSDYKDSKAKESYGEFESTQLQGKGFQISREGNNIILKVGKYWNMGSLENGFKIVINDVHQKYEVTQYINNLNYDWVNKNELQKVQDKLKIVASDLHKAVQIEKKQYNEIKSLNDIIETMKLHNQTEITKLKGVIKEKSELEKKLQDTLDEQKQIQKEVLEKLKKESDAKNEENKTLTTKLKDTEKKLSDKTTENETLLTEKKKLDEKLKEFRNDPKLVSELESLRKLTKEQADSLEKERKEYADFKKTVDEKYAKEKTDLENKVKQIEASLQDYSKHTLKLLDQMRNRYDDMVKKFRRPSYKPNQVLVSHPKDCEETELTKWKDYLKKIEEGSEFKFVEEKKFKPVVGLTSPRKFSIGKKPSTTKKDVPVKEEDVVVKKEGSVKQVDFRNVIKKRKFSTKVKSSPRKKVEPENIVPLWMQHRDKLLKERK